MRSRDTLRVAQRVVRGGGQCSVELLHPAELVSGMVSQVAAQPELAPLLAELIDSTEGKWGAAQARVGVRLADCYRGSGGICRSR